MSCLAELPEKCVRAGALVDVQVVELLEVDDPAPGICRLAQVDTVQTQTGDIGEWFALVERQLMREDGPGHETGMGCRIVQLARVDVLRQPLYQLVERIMRIPEISMDGELFELRSDFLHEEPTETNARAIFGIEEQLLRRREDTLRQLLIFLQIRQKIPIQADDLETLQLSLPLVQEQEVVDFERLPGTPGEALEDIRGQELEDHACDEVRLLDGAALVALTLAIVLVGEIEVDAPDVLDADVAGGEAGGEAAVVFAADVEVDLEVSC